MGKRGRRLLNKLKKVKSVKEKARAVKLAANLKKKATKDQWKKITRGTTSLMDIMSAKRYFKKEYKRTGNELYKEKYEMLEKIIGNLKTMQIEKAKELGREYEKKYPGDF